MNIEIEIKINQIAGTANIFSGFTCYEIINRKGETIAGNVVHTKNLRDKAIAKLNK